MLEASGTRAPGKVIEVSFELIDSFASVGTFVVIAASAIAAMIQPRHLRSSNRITLFTKLHETIQSADFVDARRFIAYELADALRDPRTVEILRTPPFAGRMRALGVLGNFYESVGPVLRKGSTRPRLAVAYGFPPAASYDLTLAFKAFPTVLTGVPLRQSFNP